MPFFTFDLEYMRLMELQQVILMTRTAAERASEFNSGYIRSVIRRAPTVEGQNNRETLMGRALAESASLFERSNYGMVAAKDSSVKEKLKRVRVEGGDKEVCMICLEELKVGLDASRMPCSHTFHGDCIETWLKQSHYCPICRFEMPTN